MSQPSVSLISDVLDDELGLLKSAIASGHAEQALKQLDERGAAHALVRDQYTGRYPFELLQNANDAASSHGRDTHRVVLVLTETALLIANTGEPFRERELRAISSLGRSSKDPRKTVGYKGLGFKSVNEITDTPQVFSPPHMFEFDEQRVRDEIERLLGGPLPERQRVPVYAFPFPIRLEAAGDDRTLVKELLDDGYATVVRLPLSDRVTIGDIQQNLASITPQLLLLLDATDRLQKRGTGSDFAVTRRSDSPTSGLARVSLIGETEKEEWLVFRKRLPIPDPKLIADLGPAWRQVTDIGITAAVPLDDTGRPQNRGCQPLHVYFPLEESVGLAIMLHADFVIEFDRRHVARTPDSIQYNHWLADTLAQFMADTVAPALASQYPGDGSILNVLAPFASATGVGQRIRDAYHTALRSIAFVPCRDENNRRPERVLLLPEEAPNARDRDAILTNNFFGRLLPDDVVDIRVTSWLSDTLGAHELTTSETLAHLEDPGAEYEALWRWLVQWNDNSRWGSSFPATLANACCVRTTDGTWAAPASGVFLPRIKGAGAPEIDIPVATAIVPDTERAIDLMRRAGVRDFAWQGVLREHILPVLTEAGADPDERRSMHALLRQYFEAGERPDAVISPLLGNVLLAVRYHGNTEPSDDFAPAKAIYFGKEWIGNSDLETLYGPFGKAEFLAEECPKDPTERTALRKYYNWLKVGTAPRMVQTNPTTMSKALQRYFRSWQQTDEYEAALSCGRGHRDSQRLRIGRVPDRLVEIINSGDLVRLGILAQTLAVQWPTLEDRAASHIECVHSQHKHDNKRAVPSLMKHVLQTAEWLPVRVGDSAVLRRPDQLWCALPARMSDAAQCLARVDPDIHTVGIDQMATDLGAGDGRRPRVGDLVKLLRSLQEEWSTAQPDDGQRSRLLDVAHWAVRQLNRCLQDPDAVTTVLPLPVPLPAKRAGSWVFADHPYTVTDPHLHAAWSDDLPFLADADCPALVRWLGLEALDSRASVQARIATPRSALRSVVMSRLIESAPYIALVVTETVPALEMDTVERLRSLDVSVGDQLVLTYTVDGISREFTDAAAHLQRHGEPADASSAATMYLRTNQDSAEVDWVSFGHQLAAYLEVTQLGDAMALLLSFEAEGKRSYFRSRQIETARLEELASQLGQKAMDETEPAIVPVEPVETVLPAESQPQQIDDLEIANEPVQQDTPPAPRTASDRMPRQHRPGDSARNVTEPPAFILSGPAEPDRLIAHLFTPAIDDDQRELPPLTRRGLVIQPGPVGASGLPAQRRFVKRPDEPLTPSERDRIAANSRMNGRRGEEFAFEQEKERLRQMNMDPLLVEWVSRDDESADHDLRSVDEDGSAIYIEVKSTESPNPGAPFEITIKEWEAAQRHRDRYRIYRVVSVASTEPGLYEYRDPYGLVHAGLASLTPSKYRLTLS